MIFAIVLTDTLAAAGLQHILHTYFEVQSQCFISSEEFLSAHPEQYDGYFVNTHTLVSCMEQLLPRRQRVVLVTNDINTRWSGMSIDTTRCVEDLVEDIDRSIQSIRRNNATSEAHEELSLREIDVLRCVAQGMINKEIADNLHISVNTVLSHRKNIIAKLGIKTVSGLSLYAMMNGYIEAK